MKHLVDIGLAYAAYIMATAGAGWQAGLQLASGIFAGSLIWGIAAALGLSIGMASVKQLIGRT